MLVSTRTNVSAQPMSEEQPVPGRLSHKAAAFAVAVALIFGLLLSLALRPPGQQPQASNPNANTVSRASASAQQIRWRVPVSIPTSLEGLGDAVLQVADFLHRSTDNRFVLEVFEPGEIAPALGVLDAVRERKTDAGFTWIGYYQGAIPSAALFGAVPFSMDPIEYVSWWYNGDGRPLAEEIFAKYDLFPMLCGLIGPETAGWFREPITQLDDLKGLKIRFAGLGGKTLQRLGASVTMLPGGEIFQALEKGAIDATEFSLPSADQALGFDRVTTYNYFPGWHQTFTSNHMLVNINTWRELSAQDQALLETACTGGVTRALAFSESLQGPVVTEFESQGVTTSRLPEEILRELQAAAAVVMEEEAAKDEDFRRVWESQQTFRAKYAPWSHLAYLPRNF